MATRSTRIDTSADVWPGGSILLQCEFDTWVNSFQPVGAANVTISIGALVSATSTGIVNVSEGVYQYQWLVPVGTASGRYGVTWTGTRASDNQTVTYSQMVNVIEAPANGCYASYIDYCNRTNDLLTPTQLIQRRLQLASELIDSFISTAVYNTDANGMPTDPELVRILRNATIEQAAYMNTVNDDAEVRSEYSSLSVAGVSYTRASALQGISGPRLAPRAKVILRNAGLLPLSPIVW